MVDWVGNEKFSIQKWVKCIGYGLRHMRTTREQTPTVEILMRVAKHSWWKRRWQWWTYTIFKKETLCRHGSDFGAKLTFNGLVIVTVSMVVIGGTAILAIEFGCLRLKRKFHSIKIVWRCLLCDTRFSGPFDFSLCIVNVCVCVCRTDWMREKWSFNFVSLQFYVRCTRARVVVMQKRNWKSRENEMRQIRCGPH